MSTVESLAVYETYQDIFGRKSTYDELIKDVSVFNQKSVLWICATIVTGMQLWNNLESQPYGAFCKLIGQMFDKRLRHRLDLGWWQAHPRRVLFHRRQVLLIAKIAILHCSIDGIDARNNANLFGNILLKANDQLDHGLFASLAKTSTKLSERAECAKLITEMLAVGEYSSPDIITVYTRNHLLMTRFTELNRSHNDFVDIAYEYEKFTGVTLREYEAMSFAVHSRFGGQLSKEIEKIPGALPLKVENFDATSISREKVLSFLKTISAVPTVLANELRKESGANDLTIFRKYPLILQYYNLHLKSGWCGYLMMDALFVLDKILTGPYWYANAKCSSRLHRFWGAVFESYVNELMQRMCDGTQSKFIKDPRPISYPDIQICDGILLHGDSIVLMEYKSNMFRADTKYSGDHEALAKEIENKFVCNRESGRRKGVLQLAEAVKLLFGSGNKYVVQGINPISIKNVYLYLVTLDAIGGTMGMSPFLGSFLEARMLDAYPNLSIKPFLCSDVDSLEYVGNCFHYTSLPEIMDKLLQEDSTGAIPMQAIDLSRYSCNRNDWVATEWTKIYNDILKILFPNVAAEAAIQDAMHPGNDS